MCNCPSPHDLFTSIDEAIDGGRWMISGVADGPPGQSKWLYTIGLAERFRHPELVVVGVCCASCFGWVLNDLGDRVSAGERLDRATAEPLAVGTNGGLVHLRPVRAECWESDSFAVWHAYYRDKPCDAPPADAMQVVCSDGGGRFPWEPGADPVLAAAQQMPDTPLAGPPPNRAAQRSGARGVASRPRYWQ